MEKKKFEKLKQKISEAMGKTHLGGIRGESLHTHMRAFATTLHFRSLQKREASIDKHLKELQTAIDGHLVTQAEDKEHKIIKLVVRDHITLYYTLHSLLLYEKHDLEELDKIVKDFKKMCQTKGLAKDVIRNAANLLNELADDWKAEFDDFREMVNSVWATAKGGEGFALRAFEALHKGGYLARLAERRAFREALKDEQAVENIADKLHKVKSKDDLEKELGKAKEKEKEMVQDFKKISQFLFTTWKRVIKNMRTLIILIAKSVGIHELPTADSEQMHELEDLIVNKLNEKYLHALRIDDKQLEAIYVDVKKDIASLT
ncbi:hypothetical protein KY359_06170 [Candidatus Woesearchaeota archaeon]|nr:hypothetical protein [Candidatus Woesearchaeota archaeon]